MKYFFVLFLSLVSFTSTIFAQTTFAVPQIGAGVISGIQTQLNARVFEFENISQLLATTGLVGSAYMTLGYYSAGDGGGATYQFVANQTSTNVYGGKLAVAGGSWEQVTRPHLFNHFGVAQDGLQGSGPGNALRMTSALQFLRTGGAIELPHSINTTFVGPESVRPGVHMTNVTITFNGNIMVPATNDWTASHPQSLFHFADAGSYNNLTILGRGTIDGNARNQPTSAADNYGKMMGIHLRFATNCSIKDVTVQNFGFFGVLAAQADQFLLDSVTIIQTNGSNDTRESASWGRNQDGFHADLVSNTRVVNSHIQSNDDCIAFTISVSNNKSTNLIAANNVLKPFAPSTIYVPCGVRVCSDGAGVTNYMFANVSITDNIIEPVGANGMYIGIQANAERGHTAHNISGNIIRNAAAIATVPQGPQAGQTISFNGFNFGGMYLFHVNDAIVSGNSFINNGGRGIAIADCGDIAISGNMFNGLIDPANAIPRGSGIFVIHDNYGAITNLLVSDNTFLNLVGSAVYASGTTFPISRFEFANNTIDNWNNSRTAGGTSGRAFAALRIDRGVTNVITANKFGIGYANAINCTPFSAQHLLDVRNNTFGAMIADPAIEGGAEWILCEQTTATTLGTLVVDGNRFGAYVFRLARLLNNTESIWNNNQFLASGLASGVSQEVVYMNYGTNVTGAPRIQITDNKVRFPGKLGANPLRLFRVYNNAGSGGSAVTLSSHVSGNYTDIGSAISPWFDDFQTHDIGLTYSGSTITVNPYGRPPYQFLMTSTGNTTLTFANFFHGMRGSIYVIPAAGASTFTVGSSVYTPTGGSFVVPAGSGVTNATLVQFEVVGHAGTNRITLIPTNVNR